MPNERETESIVRDHFRGKDTDESSIQIIVEEQQSKVAPFNRALQRASKRGAGRGMPEFIIHADSDVNFVVIIECKASAKQHESPGRTSGKASTIADIQNYAVDGVLHYASFVAREANVVAVAVSGSNLAELKISTFRQVKGDSAPSELRNREGNPITKLLTFKEYREYFTYDPAVAARSLDEVVAFSKVIHNFMRDYAKLTEEEKPLVVSAILLALQSQSFRKSWQDNDSKDLPGELIHYLNVVVNKAVTGGARRDLMMAAYGFISTHPELSRTVNMTVQLGGKKAAIEWSPLEYLIYQLQHEVMDFIDTYPDVDIVGQFYAEFLRYTGGDGKGLGIVLTPRHLTELFVKIANIQPGDTVIDPCAGTGGFLISAMAEMDHKANDDTDLRREIRAKRLIGIEQQSKMFALCASNMILRGDGRANLYRGSCFDPAVQKAAAGKSTYHDVPTRGLINPPYGQKGKRQHELDFVKAMMDMLAKGGIGVAVVPMSCAIAPHPARERLLTDHTLVATMSLPDELFYPVGVITCALVLRGHEPHGQSGEPTWFGYWKNDGFTKTKNKGRRNLDASWPSVRDTWLEDYRHRRTVAGRCVTQMVTAKDEWCAEAYLETDYSSVGIEQYEHAIEEFALFMMRSGRIDPAEDDDE